MKTFLRRLEILNYLSSQRTPIDTTQILQHLIDAGYVDDQRQTNTLLRMIQRDMIFLLGADTAEDEADNDFGLVQEHGQGKSLNWALEPYQTLNYDFERMPAFMALALSVTQKHLTQVLPSSTQKELDRLFIGANRRLAQSERKISPMHYRRLGTAVEFFQRGQPLHAAEFDPAILDLIYRAVLLGKRVRIRYPSQTEIKEYDLHPYGVAIMLPKLYLIGKKDEDMGLGDEAFRSFLVPKIVSIELSPSANQVPDHFSLKEYLNQGGMDVLIDNADQTRYQLTVRLDTSRKGNLITDLQQSPISKDQQLMQLDEQNWQLSARVQRTVQLRNWLLSLGAQAKVLEPAVIRDDLLQVLDGIRQNYLPE